MISRKSQSCTDMFLLVIMFTIWCGLSTAVTSTQVQQSDTNNSGEWTGLHLLPRRQRLDPNCQIYQDENAHMTFDRVCQVCHEMFRHQDPDFHAKCRSDCYENEKFIICLNIFSRNVEVGLATSSKKK